MPHGGAHNAPGRIDNTTRVKPLAPQEIITGALQAELRANPITAAQAAVMKRQSSLSLDRDIAGKGTRLRGLLAGGGAIATIAGALAGSEFLAAAGEGLTSSVAGQEQQQRQMFAERETAIREQLDALALIGEENRLEMVRDEQQFQRDLRIEEMEQEFDKQQETREHARAVSLARLESELKIAQDTAERAARVKNPTAGERAALIQAQAKLKELQQKESRVIQGLDRYRDLSTKARLLEDQLENAKAQDEIHNEGQPTRSTTGIELRLQQTREQLDALGRWIDVKSAGFNPENVTPENVVEAYNRFKAGHIDPVTMKNILDAAEPNIGRDRYNRMLSQIFRRTKRVFSEPGTFHLPLDMAQPSDSPGVVPPPLPE